MSGSALLLELLHEALPEVPIDRGVAQANTGNFFCDVLPLLTIAPMASTLQLYWRRGRRLDFLLFGTGFSLAVVYHWLHMHPDGIAAARLLGLPGATWRGLDILMAQALLARTLGHALNVQSPLGKLTANLVFPATLLAYAHLLADGVLTLGVASRVLVAVLLATVAAKAGLEGWGSLPKYCPRRGKRTLACFALGFAVFPLPELLPRHYWLFHSVWHLLMADAYQMLYLQLEGLPDEEEELARAEAKARRRAAARARRAARRAAAASSAAAAASWVQSLLQPAQRFARYQQEQADDELSCGGSSSDGTKDE